MSRRTSSEDVPTAWRLAHDLNLTSTEVWEDLVAAYETTDPIAVIRIQQDLVEAELQDAGAAHYKRAARRLRHLRATLNATTPPSAERSDQTSNCVNHS